MEELGSLWSYQEGIDDLKQKLLYATLELESVKLEANQEIVKNRENVRNLLNLLQMAYKERDEAKNQLQKLLNKLMLSHFQAESPLVIPTKANSSITESNSLSDTYNPQSHGSSPADSFFDTVSSPDFSNINMADSSNITGFGNQPFVPEYNASVATSLIHSGSVKIDPTSMVIDNIVKGKKLPEKGKFLQAVMEAGPLLQTLLVAGPLPRWRNPPPLHPFKIPPVSIKGCETASLQHIPAVKPSNTAQRPLSSYSDMSRGSPQMCSTSMLNFSSGPPGSCFNNALMSAPRSSFSSQIPAGKRQRFH